MEVDHKDGDRTNDTLANYQLMPSPDNKRKAMAQGLSARELGLRSAERRRRLAGGG